MTERPASDAPDRVAEVISKLCGRFAARRGSIETHVPIPATWLRDLYEATHPDDPDELDTDHARQTEPRRDRPPS